MPELASKLIGARSQNAIVYLALQVFILIQYSLGSQCGVRDRFSSKILLTGSHGQ